MQFSEENWKRPVTEVGFLMRLLSRYLKAEVSTLNENNIRLEYIGRQSDLPKDVQERMEWAREATSPCNIGMVLKRRAQLQRAQQNWWTHFAPWCERARRRMAASTI